MQQRRGAGKPKFVGSDARRHGAWMLVRMKPGRAEMRDCRLLIKQHDAHATEIAEGLVTAHLTSLSTRRNRGDSAAGRHRLNGMCLRGACIGVTDHQCKHACLASDVKSH